MENDKNVILVENENDRQMIGKALNDVFKEGELLSRYRWLYNSIYLAVCAHNAGDALYTDDVFPPQPPPTASPDQTAYTREQLVVVSFNTNRKSEAIRTLMTGEGWQDIFVFQEVTLEELPLDLRSCSSKEGSDFGSQRIRRAHALVNDEPKQRPICLLTKPLDFS